MNRILSVRKYEKSKKFVRDCYNNSDYLRKRIAFWSRFQCNHLKKLNIFLELSIWNKSLRVAWIILTVPIEKSAENSLVENPNFKNENSWSIFISF